MTMLEEIFGAGAVRGAEAHYETVGFSEAEDKLVAVLVERGLLVRTRTQTGREAVQPAAQSVFEQIVLVQGRQVFEPRLGISPLYEKIQPKHGIRPSKSFSSCNGEGGSVSPGPTSAAMRPN